MKFKSITFDGISLKEILIELFEHLNTDLKYELNNLTIPTPSSTEQSFKNIICGIEFPDFLKRTKYQKLLVLEIKLF